MFIPTPSWAIYITPTSHSFMSALLFLMTQGLICTTNVHLRCGSIHWNVVNLRGSIPLKKADSPFPASLNHPVAPQLLIQLRCLSVHCVFSLYYYNLTTFNLGVGRGVENREQPWVSVFTIHLVFYRVSLVRCCICHTS